MEDDDELARALDKLDQMCRAAADTLDHPPPAAPSLPLTPRPLHAPAAPTRCVAASLQSGNTDVCVCHVPNKGWGVEFSAASLSPHIPSSLSLIAATLFLSSQCRCTAELSNPSEQSIGYEGTCPTL